MDVSRKLRPGLTFSNISTKTLRSFTVGGLGPLFPSDSGHEIMEYRLISRFSCFCKVLERDQKISELDRRADDLQEGASQFQQQAVKLKRKYWWENAKMWAVIALVLLIVVIVVVVTTQNQVLLQ